MKYKITDDLNFKKLAAVHLRTALEETLGKPFHTLIKSASVTHTELQPEGDMFTVNFVIELHEKKEEPSK
jgi:hypothetical protein